MIPASKCYLIHNGVESSIFNEHPEVVRKNRVLCVAICHDHRTFMVKGIDHFAEVARLCPEIEFRIIGMKNGFAEHQLGEIPGNIVLKNVVPRNELPMEYSEAKMIGIFSRIESFGMVMAEGMLCRCIPVTVKGIGPAELVDVSSGIVADDYNPRKIAALIRLNINNAEMGTNARKKIIEEFSLLVREEKILLLMKNAGVFNSTIELN